MEIVTELMHLANIVLSCLILREMLRNSGKIDRLEREVADLKARVAVLEKLPVGT